jgi:hypothetical protein
MDLNCDLCYGYAYHVLMVYLLSLCLIVGWYKLILLLVIWC